MAKRLDITSLLTDRKTRVVVCTGAGGVGKTTTAAAVALRAAELGRDTVVLTIDPARRLAQALGIDELSNEPSPVELTDGQAEAGGSLHAMMLDMRRTFDELVTANTTPEKAENILNNRFYKTMVTSFAGTQEYMAMEKLGQLLDDSTWDLVVVDTPPSRNALDFLDAPSRLGAFLDSRLMRLLSAPGRGVGRLVTGAMSTAMRGVSAVVGSSMLADASEVVVALDSTFGGFTARAARTQAILRRKGTEFLVVSSAERPALREAAFFAERLSDEDMPLAGDASPPGRCQRRAGWRRGRPDRRHRPQGRGSAAHPRGPGPHRAAGAAAAGVVHRHAPGREDRGRAVAAVRHLQPGGAARGGRSALRLRI